MTVSGSGGNRHLGTKFLRIAKLDPIAAKYLQRLVARCGAARAVGISARYFDLSSPIDRALHAPDP